MAYRVTMPQLGYDMTEGAVARWRKREGEPVQRGEVIAEIETDKATVELEAFSSGVLRKILLPEGQRVPVGTLMAVIADPNEPIDDILREAGVLQPAPAAPAQPAEAPTEAHPAAPPAEEVRVRATPVARRLAEELGIDLRQVKGTGPEGRITREDVEAYAARLREQAAPAAPAPPRVEAPAPAAPPPAVPEAVEEPLSRMRQTIARRMTESKQQAPHFYVTVEVDMTEAMRLRAQLNAQLEEEARLSVNDLIIKAAAKALTKFPRLNSAFAGDRLRVFKAVNIAMAVATTDGLLAPVVHDAVGKSIFEIARETKELARRAREGHLRAEDQVGGTFTVSNLGMFDVENFAAIINPPNAAILATGSVQRRPVVRGDEVVVADVMKATISVDHRVTDGAEAAQFLGEFKRLLENPVSLLI
jgi:pyruvate dehydrogenase E2 component (dihydrolipoamide acetyltransferase)